MQNHIDKSQKISSRFLDTKERLQERRINLKPLSDY